MYKNQKQILREETLKKLHLLPSTKYARAEKILNFIEKSTRIVIDDEKRCAMIKNQRITVLQFYFTVYSNQIKELEDDNYIKLLDILSVNEGLVINSNAEAAIRKSNQKPSQKESLLRNNQKPRQIKTLQINR